jgi:hypothetical protein
MVTGGDLFWGEVETAEEVRAMADKSISMDQEIRCRRSYIPQRPTLSLECVLPELPGAFPLFLSKGAGPLREDGLLGNSCDTCY